MITLTDFFYWSFKTNDLGHEQSDHINQIITLTVITLSRSYCSSKDLNNRILNLNIQNGAASKKKKQIVEDQTLRKDGRIEYEDLEDQKRLDNSVN